MSSQDMFTTGTDTTHTILEWAMAMAELTRHPRVINKSQSEGRGIVASKTDTEDDLVEMHYLKAVIKETLQLHPSVPLLIPRLSTGNVKIHGCNIKAKTQVLVNVWRIARDPKRTKNRTSKVPCRGRCCPVRNSIFLKMLERKLQGFQQVV